MRRCWIALFLCFASSLVLAQDPGLHVINTYKIGGEGWWDYLTIDPASRHLFLSRGTHVMVIDADNGKVLGDIPDTQGVHGIALDSESGRGFTSNGREGTVTIFDLNTFKTIDKVKDVGQKPGRDSF